MRAVCVYTTKRRGPAKSLSRSKMSGRLSSSVAPLHFHSK